MAIPELKTGMLGKENDGELFVVVGDHILYEGGCYKDIANLDENLEFIDGGHICELYEGKCFADVKDGTATLIWKRDAEKTTEHTQNGAITITSDQFLEAVKEANEKFMEVAKKNPGNPMVDVVMGIQNLAFGGLIGAVLFGNEETEEPVAEAA